MPKHADTSASQLVVGTAGNVSVRVADHIVISPSGVDDEQLRARDVGVHDLSGAVVEAELAPSSELPLHVAVYAASQHPVVVHGSPRLRNDSTGCHCQCVGGR